MASLEQHWRGGQPSPGVGSPSGTGAEQHWRGGEPAQIADVPAAAPPAATAPRRALLGVGF